MAAGVDVCATKPNMKRRTPWHDYRRQGTYMLTFVIEGRLPLLGRLQTASVSAESSAGAAATVELTPLGRAIRDEEVRKISLYYEMVEVWKLCIMPDHIHMIVRVKEDMPEGKHLGVIVRGFKGGCSRAWWRLQDEGAMPGRPCVETQGTVAARPCVETQGTVAATVPAVSTAGKTAGKTAGRTAGKPPRPSLFENGYCDKILLHEGQLDNWKHYLDDNPRRLAVKRLHPDYFTVMQQVAIGEWKCQAVGNRFLLDIPQKAAVIVHRAYSDAEYASLCQQWLACGEAGGVLVSAAIAPREKAVMRAAMDSGYRIILVRENGFPPLYKPAGESFEACSEGRLLQISPWEHHLGRRIISREQCLQLNRLAALIADER